MRSSRRLVIAALALGAALMASTPSHAAESRTWTSRTGQTIEAAFERVWQDTVYLKSKDGGAIRIGLKDLSEADQQFVRDQSKPILPGGAPAASAPMGSASPKIKELFGDQLVDAKRKRVPVDTLAGKTIGIYFSAHWCPPCRGFTPSLVKFHEEMTAAGKPFEIVFVSSDRDANGMFGYMREYKMPWLAVPYGSKAQKSLGGKYGVRGIPTLVIIDSDGETITTNGRGEVGRGVAVFDSWAKK